jgi:hypothetical protein
MGQRANLIVVAEGGYALYYSHWRANHLDCDLFWGPDHALAFIRRQRSEAEGAEWLDDVWAEGGALVDVRASCLLWWGGEDVVYDVPRRRVLLQLMAWPWRGWEIRWAHEGIADLADYVGVPRSRVLTRSDDDDGTSPPDLMLSEEPVWGADSVLSVRTSGGELVLFPLAGGIESRLRSCDGLASAVANATGRSRLVLDEWPQSGAHLDLSKREVVYWTAPDRPGLERRLRERNPSWRMVWERDRYESQLEATGPALAFPRVDTQKILDQWQAALMAPDRDFTNYLLQIPELTDPDKRAQINPYALRDDPLPLATADRERIWSEALVAFNAGDRRWGA